MTNLTRDSAGRDFQNWYAEKNPTSPPSDAIGFALFQCERQIALRHIQRIMALEMWDRALPQFKAYREECAQLVCAGTTRLDDKDWNYIRANCHHKNNLLYAESHAQYEKETRRRAELMATTPTYPHAEIEHKWRARGIQPSSPKK